MRSRLSSARLLLRAKFARRKASRLSKSTSEIGGRGISQLCRNIGHRPARVVQQLGGALNSDRSREATKVSSSIVQLSLQCSNAGVYRSGDIVDRHVAGENLGTDLLDGHAEQALRSATRPVPRHILQGHDWPRCALGARHQVALFGNDRHRWRVEKHRALKHVLEKSRLARSFDVELNAQGSPALGQICPEETEQLTGCGAGHSGVFFGAGQGRCVTISDFAVACPY